MKILLVDDDKNSRQALLWFLTRQQHEVVECASGEDALRAFGQAEYPLVLSDIQMPGMSGIELAAAIKKQPNGWRTEVVLFTGHADLASAVGALRAGVYDYLQKPVDVAELAVVVERAIEHQALLRENRRLTEHFREEVQAATEETERELLQAKKTVAKALVGSVGVFSNCMRNIAAQAMCLHADRSIPVLIEGETGVGKEVVARMIHYGDGTDSLSETSFVDVNCAALAPTLFESELFGYESGAFTGSRAKGAKGKFDLAQGGTLFLDEVGEIPLELQGKLLRVLQEKEFYRVGGLKKIKTDVRVICATNVALEERVREGSFRRDLYFRLKVAHLVVPPLRERKEAILPIAVIFLRDYARQKKKRFQAIAPETSQLLEAYDWPGNIRELQNVIEYAVFAYDDLTLKPEHVSGLLKTNANPPLPVKLGSPQVLELPFPPGGYSLKDYTETVIVKVLSAHDGNQTAAADYLGISRRALTYRLTEMRQKDRQTVE